MATNFEGTRAVCEALAPLVPSGRYSYLFVCASGGVLTQAASCAGKLRILKSGQLRQRFEKAGTAEQVAELAQEYLAGVRDGT